MRRLRTATVVLAVLLTPGLAACGNSRGEAAQDDLSPTAVMKQAAAQSGATTFTFTMEATQAGESFTGHGEYRGGETPALHQVMEMPGGLGTSEMLIIGDRFWAKYGGGSPVGGVFPPDKWMSFGSEEEDDEFGGPSAEDLDFRAFLQSLFAAADVREVGEEEIDGTSTRHYVGTVTAAAVRASTEIDVDIKKDLAAGLAEAEGDKAEIEAWVDREFQVRKFAQSGSDGDGEYRMSMTLSKIGEPVDISEPAKSEVLDEKALGKAMRSQLKEAERRAIEKYGSEAELKKACRKWEKQMDSSFSGGATSDAMPDEDLLMVCSSMMMDDF